MLLWNVSILASFLSLGCCDCSAAWVQPMRFISSNTRLLSSLENGWTSLTDDGAVKKRVLTPGTGLPAELGGPVVIEYTGRLAEDEWSAEDVVDCWLAAQQGLDHLRDAFLEHNVDGAVLLDESVFDEAYVADELGVGNKIQRKKLVMAAKRLAGDRRNYPAGTVFDSSRERGPFEFTLAAGKAIRATELCVETMMGGESAEVVARCDYAYGKEGLRSRAGTVIVPPFATLCFEITLFGKLKG